MPFGLGFGEVILIFSVLLLVFGPKRLPDMGASMGRAIRDFRTAINGLDLNAPAAPPRTILPSAPQAAPAVAPAPTSRAVPGAAEPTAANPSSPEP